MRIDAFELAEPVPELHDTCAISLLKPWVDVGKVGTLALSKLERHLDAAELGRLARPGTFFDFTRDRPRMRMVEGKRVITAPNTIVRYARDESTGRDYMFLHMREPHANSEDYLDAIAALLKHFNVTEYCRIGGMYDQVPHSRPLQVSGTLSDPDTERTPGLVTPRARPYQGPTSIVSTLNESLEKSGLKSTNLMVHIPHYTQLDADHMGAARLLEVLCALYDFPSEVADPSRGQQQYQDISRAVENSPEAKTYVGQLEDEFDREREQEPKPESSEQISLSPEAEKFLREISEQLGNGPPKD